MKVVSNTSPLLFLSKIDALELLNQCFHEIFVPQAVVVELGNLILPSYIKTVALSPKGSAFVEGALGRLHRGELEAMVLAQEIKADYVLMDDLQARRKAQQLNIKPIGTIGILLLAHQRLFLSSEALQAKIDRLIYQHGLYLSSNILERLKQNLNDS
jgi:predicted nucleic acid-binding protein